MSDLIHLAVQTDSTRLSTTLTGTCPALTGHLVSRPLQARQRLAEFAPLTTPELTKLTSVSVLSVGGGFHFGGDRAFDRDNSLPLCNLYLSIMPWMRVEITRFISDTSRLSEPE